MNNGRSSHLIPPNKQSSVVFFFLFYFFTPVPPFLLFLFLIIMCSSSCCVLCSILIVSYWKVGKHSHVILILTTNAQESENRKIFRERAEKWSTRLENSENVGWRGNLKALKHFIAVREWVRKMGIEIAMIPSFNVQHIDSMSVKFSCDSYCWDFFMFLKNSNIPWWWRHKTGSSQNSNYNNSSSPVLGSHFICSLSTITMNIKIWSQMENGNFMAQLIGCLALNVSMGIWTLFFFSRK